MPFPFTLLLVFAAVVSLGYVVASMLQAAVQERAGGPAAGEGESFVYAAFTTREKLARSRLLAGYGGFLVSFLLFSLAGRGPVLAGSMALLVGILSAWVPLAILRRKRKQRLGMVEAQVLDLATGLASGLKSGQALPASLEALSGRLPRPMSEEIAVVLREYRLGLDLPEALGRLASRVPCEDLTLLVGSIRLTQQAGGSLAEVLEKMVEMIRARTEFQAKLRAMTAQGRFEAIAMSLAPPFVFLLLFFIDRPLMLPLVMTPVGWTTIVCDAVWVLIGFLIIDRIVTIEV